MPDAQEFAEFKQELWNVVSAMQNTIRRSHPRVTRPGCQHDEEAKLLKLLPGNTGTYIDIGAGEPIECSNTWPFYQKGWRGLLIECLSTMWPALLRQRPGDYLCPLAASDIASWARLQVAHTCSSLRSDWDIQDQATLVVETDTITNILSRYPEHITHECKLLSIDVEGNEKKVLAGAPWDVLKPQVIIIEAYKYHRDKPNEDLSREWEHLLLPTYKLVHRNQLNHIYART